MIKAFPRSTYFTWVKRTGVVCVTLYGIAVTGVLIKLDPKPIVIGIDPYGTRLITGEKDPILKSEKENFLKKFLSYLYNFDEMSFDERISIVGDLMSGVLWEKRKSEFQRISSRLKQEPLSQKGKILDLRQVDENHFEADIAIHIQSRLKESDLKIRVSMEVIASPRTSSKPYPWEILNYDEQSSN